MSDAPLLTIKYQIPHPHPQRIPRPRLTQLLDGCLTRKVTLLCAPAGAGKTTLIAGWLAEQQPTPAAWLSLDERDNNPDTFYSYIIAALRQVIPDMAIFPPQEAATRVLNLFARRESQTLLVLDDYHLITSEVVHQAIGFLLEHLPPSLHVIILSRSVPPLALSRLRGHGHLLQLNEAMLALSQAESEHFLCEVLGLGLQQTEVARLQAATGGWITGLRLAAQGLIEIPPEGWPSFIQHFGGDNRYIVDYFSEEVLAGLPAEVQTFLLKTSILNELHAPLCDAVLDTAQSLSLLAYLDSHNLFLQPLDDKRQRYRYHPLFAQCLRALLPQTHPDEVSLLHHRASEWYSAQNQHAAADDHARAALPSLGALGDYLRNEGRLHQAARIYERILSNADPETPERILAQAHLGLAHVLYEWDEPQEADYHARQGLDLAAQHTLLRLEALRLLAKITQAEGDLQGALALLHEAEQLATLNHLRDVVALCKACAADFALMQNDLAGAAPWQGAAGLTPQDDMRGNLYLYLTLAALFIGQGEAADALELLARLRPQATLPDLLRVMTLEAAAYQSLTDTPQAVGLLERALQMAETENYLRPFLERRGLLGQLLPGVLRTRRGISPLYRERLLSALGDDLPPAPPPRAAPTSVLVAPLSERELDVLRLVVAGLSNREIAGELFVSEGTVKTHIKSIYSKLDVHSRTQASARAHALGLLNQ